MNEHDAEVDVDNDGDISLEADRYVADWLDDPSQESEDVGVDEYDIVSAPNDWNVATIVNFIESGAVKIPPFQRNYVWDIKRASKLIESLLLGLPVPQVFLYEEARNSFLVIDGQQRLLSLYFFCKERFPKSGSRSAIRALLNDGNGVSEEALNNDTLFDVFRLRLAKSPTGTSNKFNRLSYRNLGADKTTLDLRTIRNVVVKQTRPEGHGAIFEIFSRLNTGGVNLTQQEIRASLYHSEFMSNLVELNLLPEWRTVIGSPEPDARMRDSESILRAMALARDLSDYSGTMAGFVNNFCIKAKLFSSAQIKNASDDFRMFLSLVAQLPTETFQRQGKFSGVLFESFYSAWVPARRGDSDVTVTSDAITSVKNSSEFAATLQEGSTKPINVRTRVNLAEKSLRVAATGS